MDITDRRTAYFLLRLALGVNLFIHGFVRLGANYNSFTDGEMVQFLNSPLPAWSISLMIHSIPCIETAIGLLLILGLASRFAYIAGSLLMVSLIYGMGTLQKWDAVSGQMIYVLFYALLLFGIEFNCCSLDHWLHHKAWVQKEP